MEIIKLPGMNRELAPPKDWDAEKDGECGTLPVFAEVVNGGMTMTSAWKPSEEELNELVKGGVVAMVIYGTMHPPIALGVFPADVVVGQIELVNEDGVPPVLETVSEGAADLAANDDEQPAGHAPLCQLCGLPMPPGEEVFMYHGHSGPCPEKAT